MDSEPVIHSQGGNQFPGATPVISKKELSTPAENGEKLFDPPLGEVTGIWQQNLSRTTRYSTFAFGDSNLASLQRSSRNELLQLARQYSSSCLDRELPTNDPQRIILAGHQPELFHPGVWLKNFLLAKLAQQFQAVAINLNIDNDLCSHRSIQVPVGENVPVAIVECTFDATNEMTLYEGALIRDFKQFCTAGDRIVKMIKPLIPNPIIRELWHEVVAASERLKEKGDINLGQAIAGGRHRFESQIGLTTMELPLSRLAQTESFAQFVWAILVDAKRFVDVHNQGLIEYRRAYALRSKTHPFPELEQRDGWTETPFWVVLDSGRRRRPLFVRNLEGLLELSDLEKWHIGGFKDVARLFEGFANGQIQIRPRALTTTLYSRLMLSDLFVHGIGGGKYDQLTDWISARFWGIELPDYIVASATYKLFPGLPTVSVADLAQLKQRLRDLQMNPDRHVLTRVQQEHIPPEILAAVEVKRDWISGRSEGTPKERHFAIAESNRLLTEWAVPLRLSLEEELAEAERRWKEEEGFGSREFSFCLHPVKLIDELLELG